jgi:glyoxylase I family protein
VIYIKGTNKVIGGGGFHHIAMRVGNFDASVKFYTEILGFTKKISWDEGDKRGIMLDSGDGGCLEIFAGGSLEQKPAGFFIHLALRTDDCDAAINRVKAAGMEITMEPNNIIINSVPPTPARIAFFKGLDGEVIELFQNK